MSNPFGGSGGGSFKEMSERRRKKRAANKLKRQNRRKKKQEDIDSGQRTKIKKFLGRTWKKDIFYDDQGKRTGHITRSYKKGDWTGDEETSTALRTRGYNKAYSGRGNPENIHHYPKQEDNTVEVEETTPLVEETPEPTFGEAFKQARADKKRIFEYKGKKYHTRQADETEAQWNQKFPSMKRGGQMPRFRDSFTEQYD